MAGLPNQLSGSMTCSILTRNVNRYPLKRSLSTTRILKEGSSSSPPKSPGASNVPAKAPRSTKVPESKTRNKFGPADIKPYTPEEKARLAKKYTPAQLSAIEAGEAAVSPEDLYEQGVVREDSFRLEYQSDDLSKIMPVLDKPIIAPEENYDPNLRLKTTDEIASDLADFIESASETTTHVDYLRFIDNMRLTVGKEEAERNSPSYEAPEIPRGIPALQAVIPPKDVSQAVSPRTKRLLLQTGYTEQMLKSFRVRILVVHRVVNQTRLGKIQSMYYLAVAGNGKGLLGIGEGKSAEAMDAVMQAKENAIKNMQPIPRYEKRTIFGDIRIKVGAVELELMSRPPGTYSALSPIQNPK